jgi:hypothetical protein
MNDILILSTFTEEHLSHFIGELRNAYDLNLTNLLVCKDASHFYGVKGIRRKQPTCHQLFGEYKKINKGT